MKYYIAENGQPVGPFELNELLRRGLTANSLLWNDTMPNWTAASDIPEVMNFLRGTTSQSMPPVPPQPQLQYGQPQYAQQPAQAPQPPRQQMGPMPDTHLAGAILVTLFCCMPFGIIAIIKSTQVSSNYNSGDYIAAVQASKEAHKWIVWGIVSNIILILLYVLLFVVIGIGGALASS